MAERIYKVRDPSGAIREIKGPEGATDEQVIEQAKTLFAQPSAKPVAPQAVNQAAPAEPSMAQKIAANPITRFAVGAASPILGIAEMIPGPTGAAMRRSNETLKQMTEAGKEGYGSVMNVAGSAADIAGNVLSPASLGLMKLAQPATMLGKIGVGAGIGGVSSGIGMQGETSNIDRAKNAAIAATIGGAIPVGVAGAGKVGELVGNITGPMREFWRTNQGRKFLEEKLGGPAREKVIQAISQGQGAGKTSVADDIAAMNLGTTEKFGSPLVAIEDRLATQAGGLSDAAKTLLARQDASQRGLLANAAGAPSQEKAILAQGGTKGTLGLNVGPKLEQELSSANVAGKALPKLQGDADKFSSVAADKVQDVRRFTAAGELADDLAQNFTPVAGQPRIPGRYSYADDLSKRAESVAAKSADDSLILGEQARHSQMMADSLEKHGFKPLSGNALLSKINTEIMTPGTGDIKLNEKVLKMVAARVKSAADKQGGRLDSKSLQAIRQTEIDDVVDRALTGNQNVSKERMAGVVNSLKSSIDDAIEAAGGTGWRAAMDEWSAGMKDISRQKMNAVALRLFDKEKEKLVSLAQGNEPELVKKMFPVGAPVLGFQMGGKDDAIQQVAKEISRNMERTKLGSSVDVGHLFEIADKTKGAVSIPSLLSRPATIANWIMKRAGQGADEKITQDMGNLMLTDPAGFSKKYLENVPKAERQLLLEEVMKRIPVGAGVATGAMVNK